MNQNIGQMEKKRVEAKKLIGKKYKNSPDVRTKLKGSCSAGYYSPVVGNKTVAEGIKINDKNQNGQK